jgi:hypothetical protein
MDVCLHDHRIQRLIDPPPALKQTRKERARTQLRNLDFDVAAGRGNGLGLGPVTVVRALSGAFVAAGTERLRGLDVDQRLQASADQFGEHTPRIGAHERVELGQQGAEWSWVIAWSFGRVTLVGNSLIATRWPTHRTGTTRPSCGYAASPNSHHARGLTHFAARVQGWDFPGHRRGLSTGH